jgi:hypothetical protein
MPVSRTRAPYEVVSRLERPRNVEFAPTRVDQPKRYTRVLEMEYVL